jgi:hypothetical protein
MGFRTYSSPRGSIHDVAIMTTLGTDPSRVLIVSETTLYMLQNLAALDIGFMSRYAKQRLDEGYMSVEIWDDEHAFVLDAIDRFQVEVFDMACSIQEGLESIANSLALLADRPVSSGGCGSIVNEVPLASCLVNVDNDMMTGPDEEEVVVGVGDPPAGFDDWPEYMLYKCSAAHFVWRFVDRLFDVGEGFAGLQLVSAIAVPMLAGWAGILPASLTPVGFVILLASMLAIAALSIYALGFLGEAQAQWRTDKDEIVCALFQSSSSAQAIAALSTYIEDALQAIVWTGLLAPLAGQLDALLGTAFSQLENNGLVEPLFKLVVVASGSTESCDCAVGPWGAILSWADWDGFETYLLGGMEAYDHEGLLSLRLTTDQSGRYGGFVRDLGQAYTGLWDFTFTVNPDNFPVGTYGYITLYGTADPGSGWDQFGVVQITEAVEDTVVNFTKTGTYRHFRVHWSNPPPGPPGEDRLMVFVSWALSVTP